MKVSDLKGAERELMVNKEVVLIEVDLEGEDIWQLETNDCVFSDLTSLLEE